MIGTETNLKLPTDTWQLIDFIDSGRRTGDTYAMNSIYLCKFFVFILALQDGKSVRPVQVLQPSILPNKQWFVIWKLNGKGLASFFNWTDRRVEWKFVKKLAQNIDASN